MSSASISLIWWVSPVFAGKVAFWKVGTFTLIWAWSCISSVSGIGVKSRFWPVIFTVLVRCVPAAASFFIFAVNFRRTASCGRSSSRMTSLSDAFITYTFSPFSDSRISPFDKENPIMFSRCLLFSSRLSLILTFRAVPVPRLLTITVKLTSCPRLKADCFFLPEYRPFLRESIVIGPASFATASLAVPILILSLSVISGVCGTSA